MAADHGTWHYGAAHEPRDNPHHRVQYRYGATARRPGQPEAKFGIPKLNKKAPGKKKKKDGQPAAGHVDPAKLAKGKFLVVEENRDYEPINPKVRDGADADQDPRSRPPSEGVAL
jgi:hypothetical protein